MNQLHKVIVDNKISPDWKKMGTDRRRQYAVVKKGGSPPGLFSLRITNGDPGGFFTEGQVVQIIAHTPEIGYVFDTWGGDISIINNPTSPVTSLTMPAHDVDISAVYKPGEYTLTVNNGSGDGVYNYQELVEIEADAPPVWTQAFDQWIGDVATISNIFNSLTIITIPPNNATIEATYSDIMYNLNITNGDGDGTYLIGTIVNIVANTPPFGKKFGQWMGDVENIIAPHLASTQIDMRGNYNITAVYVDIIPFDPDADDMFFDIPSTPIRQTYDNSEMINTPIDRNINRYFDIPDHDSRISFKGLSALTIGIGSGGNGANINLNKDMILVDMQTPSMSLNDETIIQDIDPLLPTIASPGGGNGVNSDMEIATDKDMYPMDDVWNGICNPITDPLVFTQYEGLTQIASEAIALIQSGFAGGEVTLAAVTDNNSGNTGIYTTTPVGDYIGLEFTTPRRLSCIQWYSLARNGRIQDFVIERYNSGVWTKVPIIEVGSLVTIINTDEGQALNINGWMTSYFNPVEDTQFRIRCLSYYNADANCGVSELRFYETTEALP